MNDTIKAAIVAAILTVVITGLFAVWGEITDLRRVQLTNMSSINKLGDVKESLDDHEDRLRTIERECVRKM